MDDSFEPFDADKAKGMVKCKLYYFLLITRIEMAVMGEDGTRYTFDILLFQLVCNMQFQQKNIQFLISYFLIFYSAACVEILRALDDGDVKERLSRAREAAGSDMVRVMREVFPIVTQVKI